MVVHSQARWSRLKRGVARTLPHPRIELRQRHPPCAFVVEALVAGSVDLLAEHVMPPDYAQKGVGEADEHRRVERHPFTVPRALDQHVEPDLSIMDYGQATQLELGMTYVLYIIFFEFPVIPLVIGSAVGKRLWTDVVGAVSDVLRNHERRFHRRQLQAAWRRVG